MLDLAGQRIGCGVMYPYHTYKLDFSRRCEVEARSLTCKVLTHLCGRFKV